MKCLRPRWCLAFALFILIAVGARLLFLPGPMPFGDPATILAGQILFTHEWTPGDPLSGGDGLGPVFNATSCVACHYLGGVGGAGDAEHNVTTYVVLDRQAGRHRQGVLHARANSPAFQETLAHVHPALPRIARPPHPSFWRDPRLWSERLGPPIVHLSQRNTPALFGAGLIDAIPEQVILAEEARQSLDPTVRGRALRLADGRIGKFGWKAQTASLSDFVRAACANELGLSNPDHPQPASLAKPDYRPPGVDLTAQQCDQMTAFVASRPRPVQKMPDDRAVRPHVEEGQRLFWQIGCAACHTPDLGPVKGLYSDLLLHWMGQNLASGGGSYGAPKFVAGSSDDMTAADEWRTPPLWGVADSAPYLHDGRAANLDQAIRLHGGQAEKTAERYGKLSLEDRGQLIAFLKSLRAP